MLEEEEIEEGEKKSIVHKECRVNRKGQMETLRGREARKEKKELISKGIEGRRG